MADELQDPKATTRKIDAPKTLVEKQLSPAQKRDLTRAIVTGVTLAALVVGLLFLGAKPFFGLVLVVILIAQAEFYKAVRNAGHDPATALGLVSGAVLLVGVFIRGESAAGLVLFLTLAFSFAWYIALEKKEGVVLDVGLTLLGVVYIALPGSFVGIMAARPDGRGVVITAIGAAAVYDILAYAGGSKLGKRPLAKSISPHKTWEGAAVATAGTLILVPVIAVLLGPWEPIHGLVFAAMVAVAAPMGDLFESLVKRDLGIKDMGTIFPGHGGALDRIDAILFVVLAAFLSIKIFGL